MNRRSFLRGIGVGLLALNSVNGLKGMVEALAFDNLLAKRSISVYETMMMDYWLGSPQIVVIADGRIVWAGPSPYPDGLPPS